MSALQALLDRLLDLMAQADVTVADVAQQVGSISRDPGPPLPITLKPASPLLESASLARHPDTGAPYLLTIALAASERQALVDWQTTLGPYRRGQTDFEQPRSVIFDRRRRGREFHVALIADLEGGGGVEQAPVTQFHLRRDPVYASGTNA